jgi:hypothetical protein
MTTTILIILIIVVEIIATPRLSRLFLKSYPKISSEAIGKLHPELGNVVTSYQPLTVVVFMGSIIFFVWIMTALGSLGTISWVLLLGSPFLALSIFDGVLALITNIYPATTKKKWDDFVYCESKSDRWIAKTQIGISMLVIAINIVVWIVYRG